MSSQPRRSSVELLRRTGAVVVAHSRTDLALRCVESVVHSLPPENVVVVVNAPESADPAGYAVLEERVKVVSPPRLQGYGANLNLGVRSLPAGLDFWLLTNDDVEFADDALERLLTKLSEDPTVGIAGPALHTTDGRRSWAYAPFPTAIAALLSVAVLPLGSARGPLTRRAGALAPAAQEPTAEGWICGAAMLVRATAYSNLEGFDEDFFMYFDEVDFCLRLRQAGWKVAWVSDAPALHLAGSSTAAEPRYRRLLRQNRRLYFLKRLGRVGLISLQAAQVIALVVGCMYNVVAAAIRPGTARQRFSVLRNRFEDSRLFLLGPRIRP